MHLIVYKMVGHFMSIKGWELASCILNLNLRSIKSFLFSAQLSLQSV